MRVASISLSLIMLCCIAGCAGDTTARRTPAGRDFTGPRALTDQELLRALRGRTLEGLQSDRSYVRTYFAPDGRVSALVNAPDGGKHSSSGVWEVRGDSICFSWRNRDWTSGCASVILSNGGSYSVRPLQGGPTINGAKFLEGNPYGLRFN